MSECKHGQLARSCEICERDAEIKALKILLNQCKPYMNEWYEGEAIDDDDLECYEVHNANIRILRAAIDEARGK